ncbi:hypothetical protein L226DRAFT_553351 [Lentinus tigrinus ALCF2SS1-7]|uniref:uncharacterized protein n=1 Tax=Lentinus tigrinus ALCF2SS1-7 TaxID=1328758 RepID=UPI0011661970|nr:hypothetical protein L226DRAFT_553351 [Lentinus tigrinus ALCF2SS1-7]
MESLPEELICRIFDFLESAGALSVAMLVCPQWYMRGARNLHQRVVINLLPGLSLSSSATVIRFMKRLVSPLSTAHFIHHLTLSGFATIDIQELILDILGRARALRSLDMHALQILQGGMLLPQEVFTSDTFMWNLSSLNASSAQFCASLSYNRPIVALRVHEPMDDVLLRRLTCHKGGLASRIVSLELALSVDSTATAVTRMAYLASTLAEAPLRTLALQFVLDRPGPVAWTDFKHAIGEMGASLRSLQNLRSLSLVIRPDPIITTTPTDPSASGDQYREVVTKQLAEKLITENTLSSLDRIELRWHGWTIRGGHLEPFPRTELLRLPHRWWFADSGGRWVT